MASLILSLTFSLLDYPIDMNAPDTFTPSWKVAQRIGSLKCGWHIGD
jgi:hypothetical protein